MDPLLPDVAHEFRRHKSLADRALADLSDEQFFRRPGEPVNPVALIVKHLAGNLVSRWGNLLNGDGESPLRDRDREFRLEAADTRPELMAAWERGWQALFDALAGLETVDLAQSIEIRGEPHTLRQALLRGATHAAYHTGQILYLARWLKPEREWLTIAPGHSGLQPGTYRRPT